ncbi:MAG: hypothetical protein LBC13_00365 [Clostridiales bacterium]|jgi:hypothetical protein|nr:hypothetical protein [Clostridiales bacterium]
MKRKTFKIFGILILTMICLSALSACTTSESDFYAGVENSFAKVRGEWTVLTNALQKEEVYSCTYIGEIERLYNFDAEKRVLPENKNPAEKNIRAKTRLEYYFVKSGGDYYLKETVTEVQTDENGMPVFSDADYKNPVYKPAVVTEYLFTDGVMTSRKDGAAADGESVPDTAENLLTASLPDDSAVFFADYRKWFSETVSAHTSYFVFASTENGSADIKPFRGSGFASGYGEDLRFDWEKITGVISRTVSYTSKKGRITALEYYEDEFQSNQKKTVQIWNNSETIVWNGDKTASYSYKATFKYPDKKNKIALPSFN